MSVAEDVVLDRVSGVLKYIAPTRDKPHSYMYDPPPGVPKLSATYEDHVTTIRSLRPSAGSLSLDVEGFRLVSHRSAVRDFYSEDEVRSTHYPEVASLLAQETGATRVHVFDHTVRRRLEESDGNSGRPRREPVPRVHVDY